MVSEFVDSLAGGVVVTENPNVSKIPAVCPFDFEL